MVKRRSPTPHGSRDKAVFWQLLDREDVTADLRHKHGHTPLLRAALSGDDRMVTLLLDRVDVCANARNDEGRIALCWAAINGSTEVVQLLLG